MIATTLEQSRKLVAIGIDQSTADMFYCHGLNLKTNNWEYDLTIIDELFKPDIGDIPAWSLSALLELMPRSIKSEKNGQTYLSFHRGYEDNWMIEYSFDDIDMDYLEVKFEQRNPVDAAVEMVIWLKENKFI